MGFWAKWCWAKWWPAKRRWASEDEPSDDEWWCDDDDWGDDKPSDGEPIKKGLYSTWDEELSDNRQSDDWPSYTKRKGDKSNDEEPSI